MTETVHEEAREYAFSWTRGGPFYDVLKRAHLIDERGWVRWKWIVAIAWVPIMIATAVRLVMGKQIDPLVLDPTLHVRLLVSLPLLLVAHHVLEGRTKAAMVALRHEQVAHREVLDRLAVRAERIRTSPYVEAILAITALSGGQVALWGGKPALLHGAGHDTVQTFVDFWHATVTLPFVQFLVLRFLWRWAVWTYVLIKVSRAQLALNALHPDQAAGVKMLGNPVDAFSVFVAASMVVASAAWTAKVNAGEATLKELAPRFIVFMLMALVLAFGPLLLFTAQIYRARHQDVSRYHAFAHEYVSAFRRKWITGDVSAPRTNESPLGTPDLQSLNDLDGSFEKSDGTRALPFDKRPVILMWLAGLLPMVPFVLATIPLPDIARQLAKMLQLPAF